MVGGRIHLQQERQQTETRCKNENGIHTELHTEMGDVGGYYPGNIVPKEKQVVEVRYYILLYISNSAIYYGVYSRY